MGPSNKIGGLKKTVKALFRSDVGKSSWLWWVYQGERSLQTWSDESLRRRFYGERRLRFKKGKQGVRDSDHRRRISIMEIQEVTMERQETRTVGTHQSRGFLRGDDFIGDTKEKRTDLRLKQQQEQRTIHLITRTFYGCRIRGPEH